MKFKTGRKECDSCHKFYDKALGNCPYCNYENNEIELDSFNKQILWLDLPRQIILFLLTFAGLQIVALIAGVIVGAILFAGGNYETIDAALSSVEATNLVNTSSYIAIAVAIAFTIFPYRKRLLDSFKNWQNYAFGLLMGFIIIGITVGYGMITNPFIAEHFGQSTNQNQAVLNSVIAVYPAVSFIMLGIVGPVVEEFGYRVGLFNFLLRGNRIFAYIVSAIVFGFIHFNFAAGSLDGYLLELILIPSYIIAGLILCFTYEKFGLAGSIVAHITNNLVSVITIIIGNALV